MKLLSDQVTDAIVAIDTNPDMTPDQARALLTAQRDMHEHLRAFAEAMEKSYRERLTSIPVWSTASAAAQLYRDLRDEPSRDVSVSPSLRDAYLFVYRPTRQ